MKKIISMLMLFACYCAVTQAQVKAGDVISGTVQDDIEPLMMVNVVEIDANKRIVAHGVTDMNGNFSFRCVNPKDRIQISYIGYQTVNIPIDRKVFKITMKSNTQIKEVVIKSVRKSEGTGLQIPVTEISVAQQSIDMKEFEGLAMTSVDEALQGRIAGLDIVMNSGNLGSGTTMRLRGVSTITGNAEPLIVVNGNVWTNDRDDQAGIDYSDVDSYQERFAELLNVNPEDIQKIEVKKDAAATAIWGSRGANGVIEIITRRGQKGKTRVSYSFKLNGTWQPRGIRTLNGDDYTMFLKEAYFNPTLNSRITDNTSSTYMPEINYDPNYSEYQMFNNNTDWEKEVKQFGLQQSHYIALTGGGEKARFRISGGYDHQTGTVIKQRFDRFTTRVALDYYVSDRITVQTNFNLSYADRKLNNTQYGGDLLSIAYKKMPNIAVYEEDRDGNRNGGFYTMDPNLTSTQLQDQLSIPNPVAVAYLATNNSRNLTLSPEFILQYDLLGTDSESHRLKYEGQVIFNIQSTDTDSFLPTSLQTGGWTSSNSNSASSSQYKSNGFSTRHSLTYTPYFHNTNHRMQILARAEYESGNSTSQNLNKYGLATGDITSPLAGGVLSSFSSGSGRWRSNYYTAQAHYSYKGKYSVTGTTRIDRVTKFGPKRRLGVFGGLSARWNISDETWMEKVKWLDLLSVRLGWGRSGGQPGSEGLYYSKYAAVASYMGETAIAPTNIRLGNLQWQQTDSWNGGFNFAVFDNKLSGDLDIYTQKTSKQLVSGYKIPSSAGYTTLAYRNTGAIRNSGWEFNLNGNQIIKSGKFRLSFNVSFANNKNEVLEMEPTILAGYNKEFDRNNGSYLARVQLHNPLGAIYGFRYKGVYQYTEYSAEEIPGVSGPDAPVARNAEGEVILNENGRTKPMRFDFANANYQFKGGDAKYEDINHDGNINELDIVYLASSLPKLNGGFGFRINYGDFTANFQFVYRFGNKVVNGARMNAENMYNNNNQSRAVNWRWHNEGDIAVIPRALYSYGYNWLGSDRFIEDASYLRLNYVSFGYAVKPKLLKPYGLSSLSVNLNLNNVFVITKYSGADPEVAQGGYSPATDNGRTPRSKYFTFGLTLGF